MVLEDIKEKTSKINVGLGLLFGVLSILAPIYSPKFKVLLGIIFFLLSAFFLWYEKKLIKLFSKEFLERFTLESSLDLVVKNKDGNIKEVRSIKN